MDPKKNCSGPADVLQLRDNPEVLITRPHGSSYTHSTITAGIFHSRGRTA